MNDEYHWIDEIGSIFISVSGRNEDQKRPENEYS